MWYHSLPGALHMLLQFLLIHLLQHPEPASVILFILLQHCKVESICTWTLLLCKKKDLCEGVSLPLSFWQWFEPSRGKLHDKIPGDFSSACVLFSEIIRFGIFRAGRKVCFKEVKWLWMLMVLNQLWAMSSWTSSVRKQDCFLLYRSELFQQCLINQHWPFFSSATNLFSINV